MASGQKGRGRHDFGEAEVGNFDGAGLGEQDVFRLDVAVDDAAVVGVLQGITDLRDDGEGGVGIEARGGEELAEGEAVKVFHGEEEDSGQWSVVRGQRGGFLLTTDHWQLTTALVRSRRW